MFCAYDYFCENCGVELRDQLRDVSERKDFPRCGCGQLMVQDMSRHGRNGGRNYAEPIEMYSIAPETPDQKVALQKAGAEFTPDGIPLARSRGEKKRLLKAAGMVEMN